MVNSVTVWILTVSQRSRVSLGGMRGVGTFRRWGPVAKRGRRHTLKGDNRRPAVSRVSATLIAGACSLLLSHALLWFTASP